MHFSELTPHRVRPRGPCANVSALEPAWLLEQCGNVMFPTNIRLVVLAAQDFPPCQFPVEVAGASGPGFHMRCGGPLLQAASQVVSYSVHPGIFMDWDV